MVMLKQRGQQQEMGTPTEAASVYALISVLAQLEQVKDSA